MSSESETEEFRENASDLPRKADLEGQFTRGTNGSGGKGRANADQHAVLGGEGWQHGAIHFDIGRGRGVVLPKGDFVKDAGDLWDFFAL